MGKIKKTEIIRGVYWVEIPDADLFILCGCPEDATKHLMRLRLIVPTEKDGVVFETGPNAILLSDVALQNGNSAISPSFRFCKCCTARAC